MIFSCDALVYVDVLNLAKRSSAFSRSICWSCLLRIDATVLQPHHVVADGARRIVRSGEQCAIAGSPWKSAPTAPRCSRSRPYRKNTCPPRHQSHRENWPSAWEIAPPRGSARPGMAWCLRRGRRSCARWDSGWPAPLKNMLAMARVVSVCHSIVPSLNAFDQVFAAVGR